MTKQAKTKAAKITADQIERANRWASMQFAAAAIEYGNATDLVMAADTLYQYMHAGMVPTGAVLNVVEDSKKPKRFALSKVPDVVVDSDKDGPGAGAEVGGWEQPFST